MEAKILLALSPSRRSGLLKMLESKNFQIFLASNFQEAKQKLTGSISYDLLLADSELPDGSWHDLLQFILDSKKPCEVIVCSRCGDEGLWAEVLQCGAYDLLVEPYEREEVYRIVESCLDSRYMRRIVQLGRSVKAS